MRRLIPAAAVVAGLLAPAAAKGHAGCHGRACELRVAMKQCSQTRVVACVRRAALHHRVDFRLQLAIARCESRLRPWALNSEGSGAAGLMQFMPGTFASTPYGARPILSAKWNALAGAWLLKRAGTGPWTASRGCWG